MLFLQLLTPFWWWIMMVPFLYGIVKARSGWKGFGVGMASAGLLWLFGSLYYWLTGGGTIAQRVAIMMKLGSPLLLIAAITLVAVLAGGFAGNSGYFLRTALRRD